MIDENLMWGVISIVSFVGIIYTLYSMQKQSDRLDELVSKSDESFKECIEDVRKLCPDVVADWETRPEKKKVQK